MLERLIAYFAERHLLANFVTFGVLVGGVFAWQATGKEELPDITFDTIRISVTYPGAPAGDVEYFVTEPIEREIRGLDGVYRVTSTSSAGRSRINVELQQDLPDRGEIITEIRNTVLNVDLPQEVTDPPQIRVFQTTKRSILNVALIHRDHRMLTVDARRELQSYAFALESRFLSLPAVNSVERNGYLREEIQIKADPDKLRRFEIPFNTAMNEIRASHVRRPAGIIESAKEPKVTLISEMNTPQKLRDLAIQGGFEGRLVRLGEVAEVASGFEKNEAIQKVNGHEAVVLNVIKNPSTGILDAIDAVKVAIAGFEDTNLKGAPIDILPLDDESIDVRNRLSLIWSNGLLGFALIVVILFLFLSRRAGFWVAAAIPFSMCATMLGIHYLGHTINGTTLAAVIIVMGMVVDDAIVVAENITRLHHQGMPLKEAAVKGTSYMVLPVTAAILTTCVAFVPLYFFSGRHGKMIEFIPPVVFLMLLSSLLESILILPGHMTLEMPFLKKRKPGNGDDRSGHWFDRVEERFGRVLEKALARHRWVLAFFVVLLAGTSLLAAAKMKFVMFPDEETRNIAITGETPAGSTRYETARLVEPLEDLVTPYVGREAVGFETDVARTRRGGAAQENNFRISVEILPPDKRDKSADELIAEFRKAFEAVPGFRNLKFQKSRWGQASGSPIEILVQLNRDEPRAELTRALAERLKADPALKNVEIDEGLRTPEYRIALDNERVKRLAISPADIASTFRAALEGNILYEFSNGDEEVFVRFSTRDDVKRDIERVLDLPVENRGNYLVPLRSLVLVTETVSPSAIERYELRRTSLVYADVERSAGLTPLDIAERVEREIFPELLARFPTASLSFAGEVRDTRESQADLRNAVLLAVGLIYFILAVLFNSLTLPVIIMLAIPFGVVGIILAFYAHGKLLFGFYAAVGALGLAGVVINDSIVLLVKLRDDFNPSAPREERDRHLADIAKTRLRAVLLTTVTTVAGLLPTAYGFGGYDAMLADMMLALAWGLVFGTVVTLFLVPCIFRAGLDIRDAYERLANR